MNWTHERSKDGKLIPITVETKFGTARITPLSRGELKELFVKKDIDNDALVRAHIIEPAFTDEEWSALRSDAFLELQKKLNLISGLGGNESPNLERNGTMNDSSEKK